MSNEIMDFDKIVSQRCRHGDPRFEMQELKFAMNTLKSKDDTELWLIDALAHRIDWLSKARPHQIPPQADGSWDVFLAIAGRGFGKTRLAAEDAVWFAIIHPGVNVAVIAPDVPGLRRVCFEGDSGLIGFIPSSCIKKYNSSLLELELVNGSKIKGFTAESYNLLRGNQFHYIWMEEISWWENASDVFDQALITLRLKEDANGNKVHPRIIIGTTPRVEELIKRLLADERTVVISGSTYMNEVNLTRAFISRIIKYEGTALGDREIHGKLVNVIDE